MVNLNFYRFLRGEEITALYPNKFLQLDEKRVYVYNTLFHLPEIYLIAALIDYFAKHPEYKEVKVNYFDSHPSIFKLPIMSLNLIVATIDFYTRKSR